MVKQRKKKLELVESEEGSEGVQSISNGTQTKIVLLSVTDYSSDVAEYMMRQS